VDTNTRNYFLSRWLEIEWIDRTAVEITSFPPHIPRTNTASFICTFNPWWERPYRLISATDRRALLLSL